MTAISLLDLSPIPEGADAALALRNSADLAQHAERWGYGRFWLAEHHNMPGIASAATAVVIGHVAAATSTIRVGAGGIMLPNHAPLVIAEQFGTLATLFPGRIDLGLGRAPGTDRTTSHALRRNLDGDVNAFPRDVVELQRYFQPPEPGQRVRAVPGAGVDVPIWILGSSLFGAQLAAMLGLPYAFASHFAPAALMDALSLYRDAVRAIGAVREALRDGRLQRRRGRHGAGGALPLHVDPAVDPPPARRRPGQAAAPGRGLRDTPDARGPPRCWSRCRPARWSARRRWSGPGSTEFAARTGADEVMIVTHVFDHAARLRSLEITAEQVIANVRSARDAPAPTSR